MTTLDAAAHRDAAKRELARRALARREFGYFARYMLGKHWANAAHHRLICDKLDQCYEYMASGGERGIGRLIICMPPRYWKSLLTSNLFPVYILGRLPDSNIIIASYTGEIAQEASRKAQHFFNSNNYRALFGEIAGNGSDVAMSRSSSSVRAWGLAAPHRGTMRAVGVGGSLTGRSANLLVLDDLHKDRSEAESQTTRDGVWDWLTSTALLRAERNTAIIMMMTRWHADDVVGRTLRLMASDPRNEQWHILSLPARAPKISEYPATTAEQRQMMLNGVYLDLIDQLGRTQGDPLWREFQDASALELIERRDAYNFGSLYQQLPYTRDGGLFVRNKFAILPNPPADAVFRVWWWDMAGTRGGGDYTAGVLMAINALGRVVVERVVRARLATDARNQLVRTMADETARLYGTQNFEIWREQEPGSSGIDSALMTVRALSGYIAKYQPSTGDKRLRAEPLSAQQLAGNVFLVAGDWNDSYIAELVAFPGGAHDDQVDASTGAYNKLAEYWDRDYRDGGSAWSLAF